MQSAAELRWYRDTPLLAVKYRTIAICWVMCFVIREDAAVGCGFATPCFKHGNRPKSPLKWDVTLLRTIGYFLTSSPFLWQFAAVTAQLLRRLLGKHVGFLQAFYFQTSTSIAHIEKRQMNHFYQHNSTPPILE